MAFTTFTNGTTADADEVNANFTDTRVHKVAFTDATEISHTGDTGYALLATSFIFNAPANSLIIGGALTVEMKSSNSAYIASAGMKWTGATMTDTYLELTKMTHTATERSYLPSWTEPASAVSLFTTNGTAFDTFSAPLPAFIVVDAATTIEFVGKINNAAGTVSVKDIVLEIFYVNAYVDDDA